MATATAPPQTVGPQRGRAAGTHGVRGPAADGLPAIAASARHTAQGGGAAGAGTPPSVSRTRPTCRHLACPVSPGPMHYPAPRAFSDPWPLAPAPRLPAHLPGPPYSRDPAFPRCAGRLVQVDARVAWRQAEGTP
ncbi:hypothetical protein ABFV05_019857 [Capra hircus]